MCPPTARRQIFGVPPDKPLVTDLATLVTPVGFSEVGSEAAQSGAEGRFFEIKVPDRLQEAAVEHARATLVDVKRRMDAGLLTYWMER